MLHLAWENMVDLSPVSTQKTVGATDWHFCLAIWHHWAK